jgi:hypothetical protein
MEANSTRELAAEASKQSEYEVGVRWSPASEDVSPEAEGSPLLEHVT